MLISYCCLNKITLNIIILKIHNLIAKKQEELIECAKTKRTVLLCLFLTIRFIYYKIINK